MISRRHFLGTSSLAAAGAALTTTSCAPETAAGGQDAQTLPPSIARLSSRAAEAEPITTVERSARVEKARRLMREQGMSALALTGGTSMVYFTGIQWGGGERLFSVVIPVQGDAFVVCPAFEEDRAREQLDMGPLAGGEVRTWEEHESPYRRVAEGLRDRGLATGRIGAEETMQFRFSNGIAQAASGVEVVDATPVTAQPPPPLPPRRHRRAVRHGP